MFQVAFTLADYLVFGLMLILSAFIGIFYALKDRSKNTTDEFLLGGRKLQVNINSPDLKGNLLYIRPLVDVPGGHVNNGKLHVSYIDIGLFSRDVSVRHNVLADWTLVFREHASSGRDICLVFSPT